MMHCKRPTDTPSKLDYKTVDGRRGHSRSNSRAARELQPEAGAAVGGAREQRGRLDGAGRVRKQQPAAEAQPATAGGELDGGAAAARVRAALDGAEPLVRCVCAVDAWDLLRRAWMRKCTEAAVHSRPSGSRSPAVSAGSGCTATEEFRH